MQLDTMLGDKGIYLVDCIDQDHLDKLIDLEGSLFKKEMIHYYNSQFKNNIENELNNYLNITIRNAILKYFKELGGDPSDYLKPDVYRIADWKKDIPLWPHVDATPSPSIYKQAHGPRPSITGLAYLNDGYEGGEIYFPGLKISISPKKGSVIFFDSTLEHGVHPLISGDRKTLSCNLYSIHSPDIEEFKASGYSEI